MQRTERIQKIKFAILLIRYLSLTVFILVSWHFVLVAFVRSGQDQNAYLTTLLSQKKIEVASFEKRQQKRLELEAKLNFIVDLNNHNRRSALALNAVGHLIPSTISFKQLKRRGDELTFDGGAQSDFEIMHMVQQMSDSPLLERPVIASVVMDANNGGMTSAREFQLKIMLTKTG